MSNLTIGIIFGIGFAGWVYSKLMRRTGGNTSSSLIAAILSGLFVCLVLTTLLSILT